jgi:hypothetical protein
VVGLQGRGNHLAGKYLAERELAIASIRTRDEAEARKKVVREKILRLVGGLPDEKISDPVAGVCSRGCL